MPKLYDSKTTNSKKARRKLQNGSIQDVRSFPHESDSLVFVNVSRNRADISAARRRVRRHIRPLTRPRRNQRPIQTPRDQQEQTDDIGVTRNVDCFVSPLPAVEPEPPTHNVPSDEVHCLFVNLNADIIDDHVPLESYPRPREANFPGSAERVDIMRHGLPVRSDALHDDPFEQFLRDIRESR